MSDKPREIDYQASRNGPPRSAKIRGWELAAYSVGVLLMLTLLAFAYFHWAALHTLG